MCSGATRIAGGVYHMRTCTAPTPHKPRHQQHEPNHCREQEQSPDDDAHPAAGIPFGLLPRHLQGILVHPAHLAFPLGVCLHSLPLAVVIVQPRAIIQATRQVLYLLVNLAVDFELEACLKVVARPAVDGAPARAVAHAVRVAIALSVAGGAALGSIRVGVAAPLLACVALGAVFRAARPVAALCAGVIALPDLVRVQVVEGHYSAALPVHFPHSRASTASGPVMLAAVSRAISERGVSAVQFDRVSQRLRLREGTSEEDGQKYC